MHIDLFQQLTRHITFWLCNYCSLQNQTGCQYCMFLTNNNPIPLKNSIHVDFPSLLIDQNQDILYSGSYFDHILALFFVLFFPTKFMIIGYFFPPPYWMKKHFLSSWYSKCLPANYLLYPLSEIHPILKVHWFHTLFQTGVFIFEL